MIREMRSMFRTRWMRFSVIKLVIPLILAIFALTACGDGQAVNAPEEPTPVPEQASNAADVTAPPDNEVPEVNTPEPIDEEPAEEPDFALLFNDFLIEMHQDITYVISALGEPLNVFEAPSCAFDGIDRVFLYPGVQLHTYPVGDDDFIHTISIRDDSLRTTEGRVVLGSSLQTMLDAYGDEYVHETGMYTFTRGRTTLQFFIDDGIVTGITYGFIIEQ